MISVIIHCFILAVFADTPAQHKKELGAIDQKIRVEERELKELEIQKAKAQEGKELEDVLSAIAKMHLRLLKIRKERSDLKAHLRAEHPNDDLLYDARLHKDKGRAKKEESQDPLDKRLDTLLALMQKQYGRYYSTPKETEAPKPHLEAVPEEMESNKERYMNKAIQTQMKVRAEEKKEEAKKAPPPSTHEGTH